MDTRDGSIHEFREPLSNEMKKFFVEIDMIGATKKQRIEKQVSLSDHRSVLGKQLTAERAKRHLTKNGLRKLRRQGKLR